MSTKTSRKRKFMVCSNHTSSKSLSGVIDTLQKAYGNEQSENTSMKNNIKLTSKFFNQTSLDLAKALLGKVFVHEVDGCLLKCRIVETELYPGGDDKGSVSYNNRCTPANEPVFMPPGTTWVYLTYGMHHCINISSCDNGGAVLLRAGEPLECSIEKLTENRMSKLKAKKTLKPEELCNGPAKLCSSMGIKKSTCNAINVSGNCELWFEDDGYGHEQKVEKVVSAKRVGIDRAGDVAVNQLWRFYYLGNPNVSKPDLKCEALLE